MLLAKKLRKQCKTEGVVANCGHLTPQKGKISAYGETVTVTASRNNQGGFDYCLGCIAAATIRCAWCSLPIFIGQTITLLTPGEEFDISGHAVVYGTSPLRLVGCLRCTDTSARHKAVWVMGSNGYGRVERLRHDLDPLKHKPAQGPALINNAFGESL